MLLNLADVFLKYLVGIAFRQEVQRIMGVVHWIASQPLSLLLNNQFYPLASYPLDKELSSGQPYPVF